MFDREITLYAFVLKYLQGLTADIDDAQLAHQPTTGVNSPAWILAHLALATDYAARIVGLQDVCSAEWHQRFGPRSKLPLPGEAVPTKQELMAAIERGHERVTAAVATVDPQTLTGPNPVEWLRPMMPTKADLLAHLLTTHGAVHCGQLSAWRRQMGLPGIMA